MSHIAKVSTRIKDIKMLQKALQSLGYEYKQAEEGSIINVQAWDRKTINAEMEIKMNGPYGIAVNQGEEGLELSADWWAVETFTEQTQKSILAEIHKQYAYETIMDKMGSRGFSVVSEEEKKENLHIVVRRWI